MALFFPGRDCISSLMTAQLRSQPAVPELCLDPSLAAQPGQHPPKFEPKSPSILLLLPQTEVDLEMVSGKISPNPASPDAKGGVGDAREV